MTKTANYLGDDGKIASSRASIRSGQTMPPIADTDHALWVGNPLSGLKVGSTVLG